MRRTPRIFALLPALFLLFGCDSSTEPTTAGIDGAWALEVNAVCEGVVIIDQQEETFEVSGWIGGEQCPYLATGEGSGTIDGNSIAFGVALGEASGGGLGEVAFTGSVVGDGDRMTGSWSAGNLGGQWNATRTELR